MRCTAGMMALMRTMHPHGTHQLRLSSCQEQQQWVHGEQMMASSHTRSCNSRGSSSSSSSSSSRGFHYSLCKRMLAT
jgi:hypothetical protein